MTTEQLMEFNQLANILNYSKTAEMLFLSQPTLSRHIRDMENELGCDLFYRGRHGVALTDAGKLFLREIQPILKMIRRTELTLYSDKEKDRGEIRLVCSEQVLNSPVLSFLREFQEQHWNIRLSCEPVPNSCTLELLAHADILLTPCDFIGLLPQDFSGIRLASQKPLLAVPPHHHLGDVNIIHLAEIRSQTLIVPLADELFGPYSRNAILAKQKCHGHLRQASASSEETALLMVELGYGVMILPHHLKHRTYPHTRTLPISDKECTFPIYAYRNKSRENPAAGMFYEDMKGFFQE